MPAKNVIKQYVEGGVYHVYNRGVEKRRIFMDEQDEGVFLSYLKAYLMPRDIEALRNQAADPNLLARERARMSVLTGLNNFAGEIKLLAYCLMPNHFHFLLQQKQSGSLEHFMRSLGTRYTMYFNRRHNRVGALYQGTYKAVLVEHDEQFLHLSRYIHAQALPENGEVQEKRPSSYDEYVGVKKTAWVYPERILALLRDYDRRLFYADFVREYSEDEGGIKMIQDVVLDHI